MKIGKELRSILKIFKAARQFHRHEKLWRRKKKRRKRGRAKIPSPQPPSFLPARAEKFLSKFAVRIFVKKSSDFNQKVPPITKQMVGWPSGLRWQS